MSELLVRHGDSGPVDAGSLVDELLRSHADYLDSGVVAEPVAGRGPSRTITDHLAEAERRWDLTGEARLSGRHVVVALALDAGVGPPLLRSGAIDSLVTRWSSGRAARSRLDRLVWDLLSPDGRDLAEEQPLLAAALGAPADWSLDLPARVTAVAWAPGGRRVAVLAGGVVYEGGPGGAPRRVNDVDGRVVSLGWGGEGVCALRIEGGRAEVVLVATRTVLGTVAGVTDGQLGSDGRPAWLRRKQGIVRWWAFDQPPDEDVVAPPGAVLAVDGTGRRGIVDIGGRAAVVSSLTEDRALEEPDEKGWPSDTARLLGWDARAGRPCAVVSLGTRPAVASAGRDGGVVITTPSSPSLAHFATGAGAISAIATDSAGHCLAVAIGNRVSTWSVREVRETARGIPGYHADSVGDTDLLDADRDARALAGLIASRDLRPPLAVGLFGDWGSGKTFVLDRITATLGELTGADAPEGYVETLTVVRFNAWHYAETNLWASLVEQVLRKLGPARPEPDVPEVAKARQRAEVAEKELFQVEMERLKAEDKVAAARRRLTRQRRIAWAVGAAALSLATTAVVVAVLAGWERVVGVVGLVTALVGSAVAAIAQVWRARDHATEIVEAGRSGAVVVGRLVGRTAELAAHAATARKRTLDEEHSAAQERATRLRDEATAIEDRATSDVVGTVLGQLSTVTEYREQLSLVTHTRDLFNGINKAFGHGSGPMSRRVVIAIDDLDRCPPEKVVKVLEAVHLLFNFEMFVVVLAVDTRWLDQSLRIRYRDLLGRPDSAAPSDYLEKIIQIPLHLTPLDDTLVRKMITGLIGRPLGTATGAATDPVADARQPDPSDVDAAADSPAQVRATLTAEFARRPVRPLPARVLEITREEATAMSEVAPLVGATPRTVKRFVNTYRLLKARVDDPGEFDRPRGAIGDHEVVAFLLAVTTGRHHAARLLFPALADAPQPATLRSVTDGLAPAPELADVLSWVARNPRYAQAPAHRYAEWAPEVARFSFTPWSPTALA